MAAEVRDLTPDKLFKIAKLNLCGRAKEWFRRLQPAPADWAELRTLMVQKYGNIDVDDIRMKMDAIKQEPRERVQKYFERLDKLFRKDIEELVGAATEVERVLSELGETPYEPLREEQEEDTSESNVEKQKKPKDGKSASGMANFLEVMLNDEATTEQQLNRLCGNENAFSYTRVPRRRTPVEVTPGGIAPVPEVEREGAGMSREVPVKSKILSHFIKGKISLSPMETVLMIPGELEHLENLVKLARRKKDSETTENQVSVVSASPHIRKICVSKTHRSKTLHLPVEINDCIIEGLVDTGASMSVLATAVVRELGIMHLVTGNESYKTTSGVVTRALGRVDEVQRMNAGQGRNGTAIHVKDALTDQGNDVESDQDQKAAEGEEAAAVSDSDDESDDDEFHDSESNPLEESDSDDDFVDPEFEELINSEGPQGMLQLMLQEQTDGIMTEENSDGDDYADWIKWSSDEEKSRLSEGESACNVLRTVLL
ncbi:unnamed protein product [Sphagnum jensenii]